MNETLFVFSWAFKLRVIMMEQLRKQCSIYFCAFPEQSFTYLVFDLLHYKAYDYRKYEKKGIDIGL